MSGRFITFEGGEGAGKSTQIDRLAARLEERGHIICRTREPGGVPGAEEIRALLIGGETDRWDPLAETLLFCAARAEHLARKIRPALSQGQIVLCDRFADSTRAYQGAGQGLAPSVLDKLDGLTLAGTVPDLTLILDVPVETGLARADDRDGDVRGRFERMELAFHERLRAAFLAIASADPGRCAVIDASAPPDEVAEAVWREVTARLPELEAR